MALGLEPGERLFIRMGNSLDYALMFFAANAVGAVPIAASPMLTPREVAALVSFSGARMLAWDGLLPLPDIHDVTLLAPDDIARTEVGRPVRLRGHDGGGPRLHDLHLRHFGNAKGRASRPARDLGAAADV